jgi:outer membrane protein OmpA-like peptidoglycan-associated protein
MRLRPPLSALFLAALLLGCAHDPNPNLTRAEAEYRDAASDPVVAEHAPLLLEDARRALEQGQRAERRGADDEELDHLAYVASRRVEIARLGAERHAEVDRAERLAAGQAVVIAPLARDSLRTTRSVFFEPERATILAHDRPELARLADLIAAGPQPSWVRVEGYADETESEGLRLSQERADEVADELIERGVDPARLTVRGHGATIPSVSRDTAADRQQNRRVDIVLVPVVGAR